MWDFKGVATQGSSLVDTQTGDSSINYRCYILSPVARSEIWRTKYAGQKPGKGTSNGTKDSHNLETRAEHLTACASNQ
jgi:hypothetical protein